MMKEFKEFISRGNVIDMAIGVIVGGAFTAIVNSLVADIFMPLIGIITGGLDFSSLCFTVGEASINYGKFIQNIIYFLIVAWVIFMLVKAMNKFRAKMDSKRKAAGNEAAETTETGAEKKAG